MRSNDAKKKNKLHIDLITLFFNLHRQTLAHHYHHHHHWLQSSRSNTIEVITNNNNNNKTSIKRSFKQVRESLKKIQTNKWFVCTRIYPSLIYLMLQSTYVFENEAIIIDDDEKNTLKWNYTHKHNTVNKCLLHL